jgi:hypothetical protein
MGAMASSQTDVTIINMPLLLGRRVLVRNFSGEMVPDRTWHESIKRYYAGLYQFLREEGLLAPHVADNEEPLEELVMKMSDLNSNGQRLWRSGAVNRWLGSFDRMPKRSESDFRILKTALRRITAKGGDGGDV